MIGRKWHTGWFSGAEMWFPRQFDAQVGLANFIAVAKFRTNDPGRME
jgi:hypothetical protein